MTTHVGLLPVDSEGMRTLVDECSRLINKCNMQANILRKLTPEKYPGTYFITGEMGTKDTNGMPEKLLVVPTYGVDWFMVYERTEKTIGPEW